MGISTRLCLKRDKTLAFFAIFLFVFSLQLSKPFAAPLQPELSFQEQLRMGERMYREGRLASGESMQISVTGDPPASGTTFTCISCHLRSGLGSIAGDVVTTSTSGKSLFEARPLSASGKTAMNSKGGGHTQINPNPLPGRPAYTDESLASVLRSGIDPSGRTLDAAMPRYNLRDGDMAIMIAYLKSLSSEFSPGVDDTTLRFATIITEDVPPGEYESMPVLLEKYLKTTNEQAQTAATRITKPRMLEYLLTSKKVAYRNLSLSRWVLKGAPDTWRNQLEEYYHNEPVFALLGGISSREWKPVHDFCESRQIPALFPQTDLPVVSASDWYTLYFSKGFYQEGGAAAGYLSSRLDSLKGKSVVQVVRDSRQGRALADGFQAAWRDHGHQPPVTIMQQAALPLTAEVLKRLLSKEKPAVLIIWDDSGALPAIESLARGDNRPAMIFVSSSYFGAKLQALSDQARDISYITYPFRLPQDEKPFDRDLERLIKETQIPMDDRISAKRTYATIRILSQVLMDMKENFYRDYFLDLIDMNKDVEFPLYERLSFGPGQRYASKGCSIVQLKKGPGATMIKKSDGVVSYVD